MEATLLLCPIARKYLAILAKKTDALELTVSPETRQVILGYANADGFMHLIFDKRSICGPMQGQGTYSFGSVDAFGCLPKIKKYFDRMNVKIVETATEYKTKIVFFSSDGNESDIKIRAQASVEGLSANNEPIMHGRMVRAYNETDAVAIFPVDGSLRAALIEEGSHIGNIVITVLEHENQVLRVEVVGDDKHDIFLTRIVEQMPDEKKSYRDAKKRGLQFSLSPFRCKFLDEFICASGFVQLIALPEREGLSLSACSQIGSATVLASI